MSKEPVEHLKHIADECDYLITVSKELSVDDFLEDETLKRAVVRSLEVIDEATKKIPVEYRTKCSSIDWTKIAGMRDRLILNYMGVNYVIVRDVLKSKIPQLYHEIQYLLKKN